MNKTAPCHFRPHLGIARMIPLTCAAAAAHVVHSDSQAHALAMEEVFLEAENRELRQKV